jgi:SNF2 family DNA or RNA helicase
VFEPAILTQLQQLRYSLIILDESHEAKNPETKRTKAVYEALVPRAEYVWCLTGTPIPNAPDDLWPMLHYLEPQRIGRMSYAKFREKFCVINRRYINGYWREIVKGGKNEEELKPLLDGFWLRRTQQDVGIGKPLFSIQAVHSDTLPDIEGVDAQTILDAIETGEQITDLHMAEIRRVTGEIKAKAVVELVAEELDEGLDRIVLMCWHKSVIEILKTGLSKYGVVGIDGSTLATKRAEMVDKFKRGDARVFIGQMLAAGEAIDLSAASELMFVETSFVPKDMAQAAMRCSNHSQTRQVHVRVCALEGSIDEAISAILMRKVQTIRQLMEK